MSAANLQSAIAFLNRLARDIPPHSLDAEIDYEGLAMMATDHHHEVSADDIARAFQICMQVRSKVAVPSPSGDK
jgi:hypothetical protein